VKNVTVRQTGDKWSLSIQTEREVEQPVHPSTSDVGIDVGVVRFATLSTGEFIEPLNSFQGHEDRLRKAQQALNRKKKGSQNWKRAKTRVRQIHIRIANARLDFLHKCSTTISKNHAIVFVEDLQVRNMSRSAAGTVEHPGSNVSAKNGKTQAQFACVACGFKENADLVGAINIRRAGHARFACQVNCDVSGQQREPSLIAA
jgi:putative transposase